MGKGDLAIRVADWFLQSPGHELSYVVPVLPEPGWAASMTGWARENRVPIVQRPATTRTSPGSRTATGRPISLFSVFYDKIIKAWFIQAAAGGSSTSTTGRCRATAACRRSTGR